MPRYKLASGSIFDEQELLDFATSKGLTLEELLSKNPEIEIIEDSFQIDPVVETAAVGSINKPQAVNTVSSLENTSSELPKADKGFLENTWDSLVASTYDWIGSKVDQFSVVRENKVMLAAKIYDLIYDGNASKQLNDMSYEERNNVVNAFADLEDRMGVASLGGSGTQKVYENFKEKAANLRETLNTYDQSITEDFLSGNVIRGAARATTEAISSIPSIAESMAPLGILSISLGAASEASKEAQKEGEDLDFNTLAYSTVVGASEGLLEVVTKNIGKKMFRNLLDKPKAIVNKTIKEFFLDVAKDFGEEGLSESATLLVNKAAESVILGREDAFQDSFNEFTDTFIVGGFAGGGMGSTGAGAQILRQTVQRKQINKQLAETPYENLVDAYKLPDVPPGLVALTENSATQKFLDTELKQKVKSGDMTTDEADAIRINFRDTQGTINRLKAVGFAESDYGKAIELAKEKQELEQKIKEVNDPVLTETEKERIAEIDSELRKLLYTKPLETGLKGTAASTQKLGFTEAPSVLTPEQFEEERAKKMAEDENIDIQEARRRVQEENKIAEEKGESVATAFFAGNGQILINKDEAIQLGDIGVGAHELLHPILNALVGDVNQQQELVNNFEALLEKNNPEMKTIMDKRMKAYEVDGVLDPKLKATEYLNVFSSAVQEGDIKFNKSTLETFGKLGEFILSILRKFGFENANFDSAEGVYNFLKEYNNTIAREEGLSQRAVNIIKKAEAKKGVKVSEVGTASGDLQASKKLAPEVSNTVAEKIQEINKLEQEGKDLATKYNKEFIKSGKQQRLENELSQLISPAVEALAESTTKRLYDRIAAEQKRNVSREEYKQALKTDWLAMVKNEYDATKQDVETFLSTRGNLRANSLAKELGIESEQTGGIKADVTEQKALTTDDQTDAKIDEGTAEAQKEAKLINPVDLIENKDLREKYIKEVKSKIKDLDLKKVSFKELKDLAAEVTAEIFGVETKKITDPKANLASGDLSTIQNFINKNADALLKLLPEGGVGQDDAASKRLQGTATGVPGNLKKAFYDKPARGTKGAGLAVQKKRKGITRSEFLEVFGIVDGKKLPGLSPRGPQAQAMKGLINLFGRQMTNTIVRQELSKLPGTEAVVQDIAAGKSPVQFSKKARKALNLSLDAKESINFRNPQQLTSARNGLIKLVSALGPEKTMQFILPTVQAGYGLLGGKFAVDETGGFRKIEIIDGEKSTRQFLTLGRRDFFNLVDGTAFDSAKYEKNSTYATINGKKISTTKIPPQNTKGFISGKFFKDIKKRKEFARQQREGFREVTETIKTLYENGKLSKNDVGMLLATFNSSVDALIRTAAVPGLYFKLEGLNEDSDYRYEHTQTASDTLVDIAKYITEPGYPYSFDNIMEGFRVAIIPKIYDNIVNEYYRSDGLRDANGDLVKGKDTFVVRYNDPKVKKAIAEAGLPPLELKEFNPKAPMQASKRPKTLNKQFNNILENKTGIPADKEISAAKAEVVGANKGRFNWFIPPTAEDFVGLLYQFLGKGAEGDKQMAWFKVNLLDPYAKAMSAISRDRNSLARNYRALKKELGIVPKNLKKEVPGEGFNAEQAVRVYIWTKQGYDIPGISKKDAKALRDYVNANPELKEFGDKLISLNKNEYTKPKDGWTAGTITTDMLTSLNENVRAQHLAEWQANADAIFSEANLNKIEAAYGKAFRKALENSLTRMKTGRNRTFGTDNMTGRFTDWLTNSVGAIMFFNTRSAILQTISAVNFINFSDNNPLAAAKAFANQKQYWSDFIKLYNSDFLVDRRDGLRLNVNESDIADMAKKGGVRGVISELLKLGFTPTQIADSFAIAAGGSTFYRNRIKKYLKEGLDQNAAEEKAFQDFRETAEESQQSSRPDKISQEQAGPLGRIILAFANTPAQYARLMKKAYLDLKNGRGDAKTNISKLIYYGAVQNLVFTAAQQALFGMMFGDDEEEDKALNIMSDEEFKKYVDTLPGHKKGDALKQRKIDIAKKKAAEKKLSKEQAKAINVANGMLDSVLRGMGIYGTIVSTLKNTVKKLIERSDKADPNYATEAVFELLKISPPISSKANKIRNALRSYEWDKDDMYKKGLALNNPAYLAAGNIISAMTNIPLDRVVKKITNIKNSLNEDLETWQRIALLGGWADWEIGAKTEKTKAELKAEEEQKELDLMEKMTPQERKNYISEKLRKKRLEKEKNKK